MFKHEWINEGKKTDVWYFVDTIWWLCLLLEEMLFEMKHSWRVCNAWYLVLIKILFDISSNKAHELLVHVGFNDTFVVLLYGLLSWMKLNLYTYIYNISDGEF